MKSKVQAMLLFYGKDILFTKNFDDAFNQVHHGCSSVGYHSIGVALISIYIAIFLSKIGFEICMRNVVVAALCHDLGILGRYEKYKNNRECCSRHPKDSVEVYKALSEKLQLSDVDNERVENAIRRHMFPLTPIPPKYIEGVIINIADKASSIFEKVGVSPAIAFHAGMIQAQKIA
ncbi:MAG: HD domain-containing protein [Butyrivibrio sp.]|nr:HD domain-containing protein [Butyrivibrio sp.]